MTPQTALAAREQNAQISTNRAQDIDIFRREDWEKLYPPAPRFWSKVEKTESCWIWKGAKLSRGYGRFNIGSEKYGHHRMVYAHRWSYEQFKGAIPEGFDIDHLCRNPQCVNPDHLEAVTHRENCLRGEGFSAINAVKTECANHHPYNAQNTYFTKEGYRRCRICNASSKRREIQRKQEKNYEQFSVS